MAPLAPAPATLCCRSRQKTTVVASYSSTPGREHPHEKARVHCGTCRRGGLADGGAGSAVWEAADRRTTGPGPARFPEPIECGVRSTAKRTRLGRGSYRDSHASFRRRTRRTLFRDCCRICPTKVDVILTGSTRAVLSAKRAASNIPIVFAGAGDPVGTGLVESLARPGGNVTGLSTRHADLGGKRLELLRETVPGLKRLAIIANPDNPAALLELGELKAATYSLGLEADTHEIRRAEVIAPIIEALKGRVQAIYVCADPLVNSNRTRVNTLALAARLPAMNGNREFVEAGGLMSYGANYTDIWRRAGDYVDKILRGAKPADLPVEQPTKFDLVINLTTAKALGLEVPPTLLARADEVIE